MYTLRNIVCLLILLIPFRLVTGQHYDHVVGAWEGEFNAGGMMLRVVFNITYDEEQGLMATMDSPNQGAFDLPIDSVTVSADSSIHFHSAMLRAEYAGVLHTDDRKIEGEWTQLGISFPLTLKRTHKITERPKKPQEPEVPYPYRTEEIVFENSAKDAVLAGMLTLPAEGVPIAVVILISGSGAQDRDATMMGGHKAFRVLADYLTWEGIAVLRYDERGVGESTGKVGFDDTTEDFAEDVRSAITFLASHPEMDGIPLGLIGHSEGGLIAPIIASESENVDFIVLLGAPGRVGEEIMIEQVVAHAEESFRMSSGRMEERGFSSFETMQLWDESLKMVRSTQRRILKIVKTETDSTTAASMILDILMENIPPSMQSEMKEMLSTQVEAVLSPWMRFFVTYDPAPVLMRVACPVLALGGEKDRQVLSESNLPIIREALEKGGNTDITVLELENLNHLFQTADTGFLSEYAAIEETFAPYAMEVIRDWILERFDSL